MILQKFKDAMFRPINTAAISIMGIFTLLWGLWVASPFWDVFARADIFSFMTIFLPEWGWGLLAIGVGVAMLYGVFRPAYKTLKNGALAGFYFWLFASFNFFAGDWQNTGGITLLMIAIYCGFIALNLFINKASFTVEQENLELETKE